MNDYVPLPEDVRASYQAAGAGFDFSRVYIERGEGFDRMIEQIKADAWDEGVIALSDEQYRNPFSGPRSVKNPYRRAAEDEK